MMRLRGKRSTCIGPYTKVCRISHFCRLLLVLASSVLWLEIILGPVLSFAVCYCYVRLPRLVFPCRFVFPLLNLVGCYYLPRFSVVPCLLILSLICQSIPSTWIPSGSNFTLCLVAIRTSYGPEI